MSVEGKCPVCKNNLTYGEREAEGDYAYWRVRCSNKNCSFNGWERYRMKYDGLTDANGKEEI